jgi:hypothetical protein
LCATIAKVNGRKKLSGRTDLKVTISNQCSRLLTNVMIAYNSILLSAIANRFLTEDNEKALDTLRRNSPAA